MTTVVNQSTVAPAQTTESETATSTGATGAGPSNSSQAERAALARSLPAGFRRLTTPIFEGSAEDPTATAFESSIYRIIADAHESVTALATALREAEKDELAQAAERARSIYDIDVPIAGRISDAVTDLTRGGDLSFNSSQIITAYAQLSRHGKKWIRESPEAATFVRNKFSGYVTGTSVGTHALDIADLDWTQRTDMEVVRPIIEQRRRGASALSTLISTGRFPRGELEDAQAPEADAASEVEGDAAPDADEAAAEAADIRERADDLVRQIETALGPAPEGGNLREDREARAQEQSLDTATYRGLLESVRTAEPAVRDLVYANASLMDRLQTSASVQQTAGLMRSLDSVQAIYDTLRSQQNGTGVPADRVRPFDAIAGYLRQHPGEGNRATRNRVIAHTRLKDDFIDMLGERENRIIYRLVVSGTIEPTPVDRVHDAVRNNDGRAAAEALMELASSDPQAMTALEADHVFRNSISQFTEEVDVGGAPVIPYHLCLSLWGRVPGRSTDPGRLGGPEVENPEGDTRPLNLDERTKLRTELFDPAARSQREELDDFWGVNNSVISTRLRAFAAKAARTEYTELIRRDGVPAGQRLAESYERLYGRNLRSDIRGGVGDEGRREADRILDVTVDSASVGTVEGAATRANDRVEEKISLDQALGEVLYNGQTVSVALHSIVSDLHDELSEWAYNGGAELSDFKGIVRRINPLWEAVGTELKQKTGRARLHSSELLSNAYAEVGGSLTTEIASEWSGSDLAEALAVCGLSSAQVQERADAADAANRDPNQVLRESAEGLYSVKAQAVFAALGSLTSRSANSELEDVRRLLGEFRLLARVDVGSLPAGEEAAPLRPMAPDRDITNASGYYRTQYGIDLYEHTRRVAGGLVPQGASANAQGARSAADIGRLLGVEMADIGAPVSAPPEDELLINETNRTMVRPGFTTQIAENNATEMWRILHGRGEVHLINAVLYGPYTDEEQRLIRVAFRRLSGGVDYQFYLQQAVAARENGGAVGAHSYVSADSTDAGATALEGHLEPGRSADRVHLDIDETELATALELATSGEIDNTTRLQAAAGNGDADQIFRIVEELDDAGCRRVLSDPGLMASLESATGGVAWDRVYRILTGQATLADRLVSRSEGADGFWQFLDNTDEEGMREDIKAYVRMLRSRIEREVRGAIPDPRQAAAEVNRRVRAACAELLANADVGAILEDELSGYELSQTQGVLFSDGGESNVAHVLRDGDWTDPEEDIIASIRAMPVAERTRLRNDPEYIRRLGQLLDTEEEFRDAMNALMREGAGAAEGGGDDHLAALDEASRSEHEITGDMNRDETAIMDNLAKLSEAEYRALLANPRMRAQILAALDNDPTEREIARRMLAFRFGDAAEELGVTIPEEGQAPADGEMGRAEAEELAYLKFNSVTRIKAITDGGKSWDRMLVAAVEVYKLGFEGEGGAGPTVVAEEASASESDSSAAPGQATTNPRAEHARRARRAVWTEVSAAVQNWGHANIDGQAAERREKINVVRDAVLKVRDPSNERLLENVGVWDEDEDILEALRNASDDVLVREWTSVIKDPAGGDSMADVYRAYKEVKDRLEADAAGQLSSEAVSEAEAVSEPEAELVSDTSAIPGQEDREAAASSMAAGGGRPMAPPGSDLSSAQLAFMNYVIDLSGDFESTMLQHAGGWFSTQGGENTATTRRDNSQWHEWADLIRDRIPNLPAPLIGQALGINTSDPDYELVANPNRAALTRANHRLSRYLRQRGSNYANTRFASDEAENLDVAMTRYGRAVGDSQIGETPEGYGVISAEEGAHIEENYGREVDRATEDFKSAKAAVAQWAAIIVGVIVTAIITILTAGVATGPAAAIVMGAVTAAVSATASAGVQELIQQGDYSFSDEGLESIGTAAITGIITAGSTYYGQVVMRNLAGAAGDGARMAQMMRSASPGIWRPLLMEAGEEVISEGITGFAEAGLVYLNPTIWMEGIDEGMRRGNEQASARIAAMPKAMLQAAITSAVMSGAARLIPTDNPLAERIEDNLDGTVDVRKNLRALFGREEQVMLLVEAFASYAVEKGFEGHIDLESVPGDLFRGYLQELQEQATDMHVGTAHAGVRARRTRAEIEANEGRMTPEEVADYMAMNQQVTDESSLALHGDEHGSSINITVDDYIRLREQAALAALASFQERTGIELTDEQAREFVMFARGAATPNEFRTRLATNPMDVIAGVSSTVEAEEESSESTTSDETTEAAEIADAVTEEIESTVATGEVTEEEVEAAEPTEEREFLGAGSFADVYRDGDSVIKEIRPVVGAASEQFAVDASERALLAEHQAEFTNDLAENIEGAMIPSLTVTGPGQISQDFSEGLLLSDLSSLSFEAFDRAQKTIARLVGQSNQYWGLTPGGTGELEGGWRIMVDDNPANFLFDQDGNLVAWIDPVAVWPPPGNRIESAPPTQADAQAVADQLTTLPEESEATTVLNPGTATTVLNPGTATTVLNPGSETTTLLPPSEQATVLNPGSETTTLLPPSEQATVLNPGAVTPLSPPSSEATTVLNPGSATTTLLPPSSEATTLPPSSDSVASPIPHIGPIAGGPLIEESTTLLPASENEVATTEAEVVPTDELAEAPPTQPAATLEELYAQAEVADVELHELTDGVASETGGSPMYPPGLKGKERAMEKIEADYGGDVSRLVDVSRSSIVYDSLSELEAGLALLEGSVDIVRTKNRFAKPTPSGYRDVVLNVRMSNGHIVELQLHLKQIMEVKMGRGHELYESVREIEAAAAKENRPLTPEEQARVDELEAEASGLYSAAFEEGSAEHDAEADAELEGAGAVSQPSADIEELYEAAEVADVELRALTESVASETEGETMFPPGLKGRERAEEKIAADYGGDVSRLLDVSRASIVFDSMEGINAAMAMIEEQGDIARAKNRFETPTPSGYRDVVYNLRMSNGHIVELQLHLKQIMAVKGGEGHKLYEESRAIEGAAQLEGRELTEAEAAQLDEIEAASRELYDAAMADAEKNDEQRKANEWRAKVNSLSNETIKVRQADRAVLLQVQPGAMLEVALDAGNAQWMFAEDVVDGILGGQFLTLRILSIAGSDPRGGLPGEEVPKTVSDKFLDRAGALLEGDNGRDISTVSVLLASGEVVVAHGNREMLVAIAADDNVVSLKVGAHDTPGRQYVDVPAAERVEDFEGYKEEMRRPGYILERYPAARAYIDKVRAHPEVGPQVADATDDELAAVFIYTDMAYEDWNKTLGRGDEHDWGVYGPEIRLALAGLRSMPTYEGEVRRGTSRRASDTRYEVGAVISEPVFLSTSYDSAFGGEVQFRILSKTGRMVETISYFPNEKEVLFEPNTMFRVTDRVEDQNGNLVISMEEVTREEGDGPGGGRWGSGRDNGEELLTDPNAPPEIAALQEEITARESSMLLASMDASSAFMRLRTDMLGREQEEVASVTAALEDALGDVDPIAVATVFRYLFDSEGITLMYDNYAAWRRLSIGMGTAADVAFMVHELAEQEALARDGFDDPLGERAASEGEAARDQWREDFFPAYLNAHAQACREEAAYLAALVAERTNGIVNLTPEQLAASDATRSEMATHMVYEGKPLAEHDDFEDFNLGDKEVELSAAVAQRLILSPKTTVWEIIASIKVNPFDATRKAERVEEPVEGLYESIDPDSTPEGWTVHDEVSEFDGRVSIRTLVTAPNGAMGSVSRSYNPTTKTLEMHSAFFDDELPRWVSSGEPLVANRGTPTFTFLQLRQMKKFGIGQSGLETVKMKTIVNLQTIIELAELTRAGLPLNEAILQTHSVKYAETPLLQSGHIVAGATVVGGYEEKIRSLLTTIDEDGAAMLRESGFTPDDKMLMGFDIELELGPQ